MTVMTARMLTGIDDLLDHREAWNRLWERSDAYEFQSRAEGIAHWVETFGDPSQFVAVVVADSSGELVGGVPLLLDRRRPLSVLRMPANGWANAGDMLIHSDCNSDDVAMKMVEQLRCESFDLLQFEFVRHQTPRWQSFMRAIDCLGGAIDMSRIHPRVAIDIGDDWDRYFACLSRNHRSSVRRGEKKAAKRGTLAIRHLPSPTDEELPELLRTAFEIEHQSWKGANQSSVIACDMFDYYLGEARLANRQGGLELWFLDLDGQAVAFEYCHRVRGRCLSYKIGYNEAFRDFGPGQVLRKHQLQYYTDAEQTEPVTLFDTMGIADGAKAKWATRRFETGCINASLGDTASNLYVRCRGSLRHLRSRLDRSSPPEPVTLGGESFHHDASIDQSLTANAMFNAMGQT